jgi:acyl-CoA thioesterase I
MGSLLFKFRPLFFPIATLFCAACGGGGGGETASANSELRYVALGASDAVGVGAEPLTNGYVYLIEDNLESAGREVELVNLGIPGATIELIRKSSVQVAAHSEADLITLFTGANDLVRGDEVDAFENELHRSLEELRQNSAAFIAIGTLPDITRTPRFTADPSSNVTAERLSQFNAAILRQAGQFGVAIADLQSAEVSAAVTAADGFHPNNEGYKLMAEAFLKAIGPLTTE